MKYSLNKNNCSKFKKIKKLQTFIECWSGALTENTQPMFPEHWQYWQNMASIIQYCSILAGNITRALPENTQTMLDEHCQNWINIANIQLILLDIGGQ